MEPLEPPLDPPLLLRVATRDVALELYRMSLCEILQS